MIDINELRSMVNGAQFESFANSVIHSLLDRIEMAESEAREEARLNGMGSEREAALMAKLEAAEKERDELRAMIEAVHSILDNDESKIIRNAKDGYLEGREPKELTLTERVTALCKYAADWKRWFSEAESKIERMEQQEPVAWAATDETCRVVEALSFNQSRRFDTPLYLLQCAKGD